MSGAGWGAPTNPTPSVRIVTTQIGGAPGASGPPGRRNQSAGSRGSYVWIVMSLLIASTALALYDLYLLASLLASP